jgi:hypothetical protein
MNELSRKVADELKVNYTVEIAVEADNMLLLEV